MTNGSKKKRLPMQKVVINYPPVPTKKWIPPDKRPKKPRKPAYVKPKGITQHLKRSSFRKMWFNFWKVKPEVGVLTGGYSESHKRFRPTSNGFQASCSCVVAIVFSKMFDMKQWSYRTIDTILVLGDDLYYRSLSHLEDKCVTRLSPTEVCTSFYIDTTQVTVTLVGPRVTGKILPELDGSLSLIDVVEPYFEKHDEAILSTMNKNFALWTSGNAYFVLDPDDHTDEGLPWNWIKGQGLAVVMRFEDADLLVLWILENIDKSRNGNFVLYPCTLQRSVKIDTTPPKTLEEVKIVVEKDLDNTKLLKVVESRIAARNAGAEQPVEEQVVEVVEYEPSLEVIVPPEGEDEPTEPPEWEINPALATEEYAPDVANLATDEASWLEGVTLEPVEVTESRIPIEPPKVESISYFQNVKPKKVGILRASLHQGDPKFQKYAGQINLAAGVTVLAMLRVHKSRLWYAKVLDEIMTVAQFVHHSTVQSLAGTDKTMRLSNIYERIPIADKEFTPIVDEYVTVGRLQSLDETILDLQPALEEFFREYDACIICGPLTLAVWLEDGMYYMFDPNERDKNGMRIVRQVQIGSAIVLLEVPAGFACVTWFVSLKNLTELYLENVEPNLRRELFVLNRVQIKDYVKKTANWYNFTGLTDTKWILRGRINQNDKKFTRETRNSQSTATSVIALVMCTLIEEKTWTRDTVDDILNDGDIFYANNVDQLKARGKFVDGKLMVGEIVRSFPFMSVSIRLDIEDCIINAVINAKKENDVYNIKKGLEKFFQDYHTCVITARGVSAAVWSKHGMYFYLNPRTCDSDGITAEFGLACVIRCTCLDVLAAVIEANLGPGREEVFNISLVDVTVRDTAADGVMKPPLNNYTPVNDQVAVLQSAFSERSDVFDTIAGRHAVPSCLVALGMNIVYPALEWTRDNVDEILAIGKELFVKSMIAQEKAELVGEAPEADSITSENVAKDFKIGINKMEVAYGEVIEGNYEDDFANHMLSLFSEEADDRPSEVLLESDQLTLVIWRDNDEVYYLYDPMARDPLGQVFGKDEWSEKYIPEESEEEEEGGDEYEIYDMNYMAEMGGGDAPKPSEPEDVGDDRRSAGSQTEEEEQKKREIAERTRQKEEARLLVEAEKHLEEEVKALQRLERLKFWEAKELTDGKACAMWFTKVEYLIEHILENTPPNRRVDMTYRLTALKVTNKPETKKLFDPESQRRVDLYAGDWYQFRELDYGRWILRGNMSQEGEMFPVVNRGRQSLTNCYTALAHAYFYSLTKFKPITVDAILKYGDRLFSYTKKLRKAEIQSNKELNLTEDVIEDIVNNEHYEVEDYVRKFCIEEHRVHVYLGLECVKGDVHASEDDEEVLDVNRGLNEFFRANTMGVLMAKTLRVGVWRGENVYYMFDPNPNGPNGVKTPNGEACITRYLNIEQMANVFVENLTKEGRNQFVIHKIRIQASSCCRERQPEPAPEPLPPEMTSYRAVVPGKFILRGNFSQDDARFGRGRNVQCAPIAIVALTMTLIHDCLNWTKPIIDEIVVLGDELYTTSVDRLAYDFNPWEQGMSIYQVQKDYQIGVTKANCEIRHMDQKGVIDIKHPKVLNLRRGIEEFFNDNTHGVLQTEDLTVALWEQEEGHQTIIYMFDPNPRSATGMPFPGGAACVVTFVNSKLAADHIISLIPEEKRLLQFVITPVEIVVGKRRTPGKKCKCCALMRSNRTRTRSPKEGVQNLPRCSNMVASELARKMRKYAEEQRRRKDLARLAKIGRQEFFTLPDGDGLLRGLRSQANPRYSCLSRGNQDIPNCIASYVMHCIIPISNWTHKNIDTVLDIGEQLYVDSYITYSPKHLKLGLENVLRRFIIKNVQVQIVVYKPSLTQSFLHTNLTIGLMNYFQQENFGIVSALNMWMSVFFKGGYYYVFDPHDRDHEGNRTAFGRGCAVVFKCQNLSMLASKIMDGMITIGEECVGDFSLNLLTVKEIKLLDTDRGALRDNL